jgi:hypothetical protein
MSYQSSIRFPWSRRVRYGPLATPRDHLRRHLKQMAFDFSTALDELLSSLALIAIIWWMVSSGGALAVLDFALANVPARVETTSIRQVKPLSQPLAPPLILFHAPVARSHRPSMIFESAVHSDSRSAGFSAASHMHDHSTPTKKTSQLLQSTARAVISIPTPSPASENRLLQLSDAFPAPFHVCWTPTKTSLQLLQSTELAVFSTPTPSPALENRLLQSTALALLPLPTCAPDFPVRWHFAPKWSLPTPMRRQSTAVAVILLPVPFRAQSKSSQAPPQQWQSTAVAIVLTPARRPHHTPLPMQFRLQFMINLAQSVHDPLTAVAVIPPGTCPWQPQSSFPSPNQLELICLVAYGLLGWSLMWLWYQHQPRIHNDYNDNFSENDGSDDSDGQEAISTPPPSTTAGRTRRPRHRSTLPAVPLRRSPRLLAQQNAIPRRSARIAALQRVAPRRY